MTQNNNQETVIKKAGVAALAVIVFALLYSYLLGGPAGFGRLQLGGGYGLSLSALFGSLLMLTVRLLWLVFFASLVIGLAVTVKKYLDANKISLNSLDLTSVINLANPGQVCPSCGTRVRTDFTYCPDCRASLKETCAQCGSELQAGWKCCPSCGTETK